MGCCSSRQVDSDTQHDRAAPRQVEHSPQAVTSQTAINPTSSRPRLEPPSALSLHHSDTSQSAISTPRRSSARNGSQPVSLTDHYNLPLRESKPWKSKGRTWNRSQLRKERYEFFETRVTGRREIWDAIRQAAECLREADLLTAQGILEAAGVTLPTGRLEDGGYDEAGNLYKVPEAVLSDPTNVEETDGDEQTMIGEAKDEGKVVEGDEFSKEVMAEPTRQDKGKAAVEKDAMRIKCRLSDRGGPDVIVMLGRGQLISALIKGIREEAELPSSARIRVAYLGRILSDKQSLLEQSWKEGHVLNVLISGVYS